MTRFMIAVLTLTVAPTIALAQTTIGQGVSIRAEDSARLDGLDPAAGAALRQVFATGSDEDVALATAAFRGAAITDADPQALAGDWSCKMTKLGGQLPVVAYPPFKCKVTTENGALKFEKLTGSQRTSGTIYRDDGPDGFRLVYLGSTFVDGDQPKAYADFPAQVDPSATEVLPDVGLVEITGNNTARIVFPQPYKESYVNVLTLTR